jgi:hypothetical protein
MHMVKAALQVPVSIHFLPHLYSSLFAFLITEILNCSCIATPQIRSSMDQIVTHIFSFCTARIVNGTHITHRGIYKPYLWQGVVDMMF